MESGVPHQGVGKDRNKELRAWQRLRKYNLSLDQMHWIYEDFPRLTFISQVQLIFVILYTSLYSEQSLEEEFMIFIDIYEEYWNIVKFGGNRAIRFVIRNISPDNYFVRQKSLENQLHLTDISERFSLFPENTYRWVLHCRHEVS